MEKDSQVQKSSNTKAVSKTLESSLVESITKADNSKTFVKETEVRSATQNADETTFPELIQEFNGPGSVLPQLRKRSPGKKKRGGGRKKKSKKKRTSPGGGFGGASMEPCPCGSGETYNNCCSTLHRDVNAFKSATAEQVVRARYSAFAKKQVCAA